MHSSYFASTISPCSNNVWYFMRSVFVLFHVGKFQNSPRTLVALVWSFLVTFTCSSCQILGFPNVDVVRCQLLFNSDVDRTGQIFFIWAFSRAFSTSNCLILRYFSAQYETRPKRVAFTNKSWTTIRIL